MLKIKDVLQADRITCIKSDPTNIPDGKSDHTLDISNYNKRVTFNYIFPHNFVAGSQNEINSRIRAVKDIFRIWMISNSEKDITIENIQALTFNNTFFLKKINLFQGNLVTEEDKDIYLYFNIVLLEIFDNLKKYLFSFSCVSISFEDVTYAEINKAVFHVTSEIINGELNNDVSNLYRLEALKRVVLYSSGLVRTLKHFTCNDALIKDIEKLIVCDNKFIDGHFSTTLVGNYEQNHDNDVTWGIYCPDDCDDKRFKEKTKQQAERLGLLIDLIVKKLLNDRVKRCLK